MATLSQRQREFSRKIAELILWANKNGMEVTLGDAYRDPRVHGVFGKRGVAPYGELRSFHKKRLAIDLNLFVDGKYQASTEAHRPLGEKWEAMGGTWGGRFAKKDGNHYSWGESRGTV